MLVDEDVRLPGYRRHEIAAASESGGIALNRKLIEQLRVLANEANDSAEAL
jgi:(2R)-3-sulfolactate dehydrogenase (NADP+)